jgi:diguanylate cyclase (GGDEF)-like protein/PAS domain S-box-containing protein
MNAGIEPALQPCLRQASILVVEDEPIIALDLSHRLDELGYRVLRRVASGEDAIESAQSLRPDLVLMDINIEGAIDGIDAAHRIRETVGTPVVFMTAYAQDETLARAQACRPYGYLIKPYESRALHATIQVALARRDADATLERSAERLRQVGTVFERIADAIATTDVHRRIVSVNPAFTALTGWAPAEVLGRDADALLHDPPHPQGFWDTLEHAPDGQWRGQVGLRCRDGRRLVVLQTASRVPEDEDATVRYVLSCADLTSMHVAQQALSFLAHHDALTGLPNRSLLEERLDQELLRARRLRHGVALLFIDLDGFKAINDSLGHAAGDQLLQEVGRRLRASIRDVDTAARLGGDEFVVVMTDLGRPEVASRLVTTLRRQLALPVELGDHTVTVSASIGVAVFPQQGTDRATLMKAADAAMYAAKAGARQPLT